MKMSGDSSQQLSYLNEQLREKDREIEELQTQQAQLNEEVSRASDELILTKDYGDLEYEKLKENSQRIREELENKIEHLVSIWSFPPLCYWLGSMVDTKPGIQICSCVVLLNSPIKGHSQFFLSQTTEIEEQRSTFNFEIQQLEAEKQVRASQ